MCTRLFSVQKGLFCVCTGLFCVWIELVSVRYSHVCTSIIIHVQTGLFRSRRFCALFTNYSCANRSHSFQTESLLHVNTFCWNVCRSLLCNKTCLLWVISSFLVLNPFLSFIKRARVSAQEKLHSRDLLTHKRALFTPAQEWENRPLVAHEQVDFLHFSVSRQWIDNYWDYWDYWFNIFQFPIGCPKIHIQDWVKNRTIVFYHWTHSVFVKRLWHIFNTHQAVHG